ncbi:3-keto-disaccharide hydrolase [Schlesneria paludicola]|uniref:3-keto-disaccharide hydrolase n=1 Tax=Schlesneria paludicola TaxID=360056 RepID=UPI0012FC941F|nr:DUF1080 domain-containing protein [Schlesneria paludicola]
MNSRFFRLDVLVAVALFCLGTVGCQQAVAPPATPPAAGTAATPPAATVEPAVEDTPFELETDFVSLSRDQFEEFDAGPETWKASPDGLTCTGKPRGYLYSKLPYENFTWRLEYRFPRPANLKDEAKFKGNTGFLIYITGEHKLWPDCLEIQGKHLHVAAIKENGGADAVTVDDNEPARQKARKHVGQWNALEIVSKGGAVTASLNGLQISSSRPGALTSGLIGIQSEDHPFEVRRMRIRAE